MGNANTELNMKKNTDSNTDVNSAEVNKHVNNCANKDSDCKINKADVETIAKNAKSASLKLGNLSGSQKNSALNEIAVQILRRKEEILNANQQDIERSKSIPAAMLKRLTLDDDKLREMAESIRQVASLEDPVGKTLECTELDSGLELFRMTTPLGVIGAVFEARPDAVTQIASLCLKSGNAAILKGGVEAERTSQILVSIMSGSVEKITGIRNAIQLIHTRDDVREMLSLSRYIDLIVPRGSKSFVQYIQANTRIPVLGHADGICHIYIDSGAETGKAADICFDAKVQYPAVCNAVETILVHEHIAEKFLPILADMFREKVEMRCDAKSKKIIGPGKYSVKDATEKDWATEYNDFIVSVKVVSGIHEAIKHINTYGSGHTDAIVTNIKENAEIFLREVDSSSVFWNCSTRFADGFRYGKGAELGISTGKLHARGPVGLEGMVLYKYMLMGDGHTVADYASGTKQFTHKKLGKKLSLQGDKMQEPENGRKRV